MNKKDLLKVKYSDSYAITGEFPKTGYLHQWVVTNESYLKGVIITDDGKAISIDADKIRIDWEE